MLSREQIADRIVAARRIRGFDQIEMQRLFYEAGEGDFRKGDLGEIERQGKDLTPHGREVLARLLRVPERWFTADDPFELFGEQNGDNVEARVDQIAGELRELRRSVSRLVPTVLDADEDAAVRRRTARSSGRKSGATGRGSRTKAGG